MHKVRKIFGYWQNIFFVHSIKANFDKIMHVLKEILGTDYPIDGNFLRPGPKPKFTDVDVIALSLTAECMGIDSENYLFSLLTSTYKKDIPNLISRRQYNDRRKSLFQWTEEIRKRLSKRMNELTEIFAIDSMPLEICRLSRRHRNKMGQENDYTMPDKGFCSSQNSFYFGYKLHAVCSPSGVIETLEMTKASVHDGQYLKNIRYQFYNCLITGDRAYLSQKYKTLLAKQKVFLETPFRSDQVNKEPIMSEIKNIRKRIETVFSQLVDQFMIKRNYAKSFYGYKTRILSKICSMTTLQYINKFIRGTPVGQIKYSLL